MAGGAGFGVALKGDRALLKAFKKMPSALQKRIGRKALRAGGKIVLKSAKQKAAAITNPETATTVMQDVARGMKMRATKRSRRHIGVRIMTPPDDGEAAKVELGFIHKGGEHIAPQSFMRAAAAENEPRVFKTIADTIRKGLQDEARRAKD